MLAIFTGNGKGKTTAALGDMIRAAGAGNRAIMFQFIKGPWVSGEHIVFKQDPFLRKNVKIVRGGKGFVGIQNDVVPFREHKKAAQKTFADAAKAIMSKRWDMIVLDEINVAMSLKLIAVAPVLAILKKSSQKKIIICTGRDAPDQLMRAADLVTEMREIKHPFNKGVKAQRGFDY